MIRALAAVLLTVLAPPVWAAPVPVQSGEHADFSRLVFLFGEVPDWTFGRVPGGYELRTRAAGASYDMERIFDFIPRDRIAAITAREDGRVFLDLGCDCHGDAFEIRTGIVVDIKDGPAGPRARFETALPEIDSAPAPDGGAAAALAGLPGNSPFDLASFAPPRRAFAWQGNLALRPPDAPSPVVSGPPAAASAPPDPAPVQSDAVAAAQADLALQLARAAAQGLVEPAAIAPAEPSEAPRARDLEMPDAPAPAAPELSEASPNLRIETAVDLGRDPPVRRAPLSGEGEGCIPDDRLDVPGWANRTGHGVGLAGMRQTLAGEFDAADPGSVDSAVRAHIYLTFGAEAKAILRAFRFDGPDAELFRTLAEIVDDGVARNPGPLRGQRDCATRAALWAVLADPDLNRADPVATRSVLAAFAELPIHLRRHLGPHLAQRFIAAGDTDTASAIRNAIAQAPGAHGDGLDLVEAEIALATGQRDTAERRLARVADAGGPRAPEALIALIDARIAAEAEIPDRDLASLDALAFENHGTDRGRALRRAQVRAQIHRGAFADAHGMLAAPNGDDLAPADAAELRRTLYAAAASRAGAQEFLRLVLPGPLALTDAIADADTRRAVAARLLDLGLAQPARDALAEHQGVPAPADRLLYARSYLLEARADLAIGYLAGLNDDTALRLRAAAHEAAGEYAAAAVVLEQLGDTAARDAALWRAGTATAEQEHLSEPQRQAAALATAPLVPDAVDETANPPGPLARNRALLEHSRAAQTALTDLLAGLDRP